MLVLSINFFPLNFTSIEIEGERESSNQNERTFEGGAGRTTFAFVRDDLEEKARLKGELFNLQTKLQEMEQENGKLKK